MESSKNFSNCFQLIRNSKCPGCKWSASANQHALSSLLPLPRSSPLPFNYGVVCGPANGITVVDVDDYKSIKNTKLLKGMMDILSTPAYKTYTVFTPSGGKHFYFQYVPTYGTTHNDPNVLPLDIQGKGAYVVGAGSSINGNTYTEEVAAPIIEMPAELKKFLEENNLTKVRITKKSNPCFFENKKKKSAKPASGDHYSYYMKKSKFDEAVQKLGAAYWSDRSK